MGFEANPPRTHVTVGVDPRSILSHVSRAMRVDRQALDLLQVWLYLVYHTNLPQAFLRESEVLSCILPLLAFRVDAIPSCFDGV